MPDPACQHKRTQLIAKDDDTQYVECLDCGEIFEVGELNDGSGYWRISLRRLISAITFLAHVKKHRLSR